MPHVVGSVLPVPARAAQILEAQQVTTEVGTLMSIAETADGISQIGVHLELLGKFWCLYLHKSCLDCLHVTLSAAEGHSA